MLGNKVSGMPEIAISVHTKALIIVRIFSAFSIHNHNICGEIG